MSDESYRNTGSVSPTALGLPRYPAVEVTDNASLPSIVLPSMGRWEYLLVGILFALPPLLLAVGYSFSKGRDLTAPFLIGQGNVLLGGIVVAVLGIRRRDSTRVSVGVLICVFALGFMGFGLLGALWCGFKDLDLTVVVADAKTGKPIEGADVSFVDGDHQLAACVTDRDGRADVCCRFFAFGSSSPVCDTGTVSFSGVVMNAKAAGHDSVQAPFHAFAGRGRNLHAPPIPPIEIHLTPNH